MVGAKPITIVGGGLAGLMTLGIGLREWLWGKPNRHRTRN
jgi:hypothetical protein